MSDRIRSTPDVPFKAWGTGHAYTFLCAKCQKSGGTTGRKRVRGLWWCAKCVQPGPRHISDILADIGLE